MTTDQNRKQLEVGLSTRLEHAIQEDAPAHQQHTHNFLELLVQK